VSEQDAKADQFARKAAGWSDAEYADGAAYLAHRAELVATLGVALAAGDEVLDLACGDGGPGSTWSGAACATSASTPSRRWSSRRGAASARGRSSCRAT
jgi:hypothetical protein